MIPRIATIAAVALLASCASIDDMEKLSTMTYQIHDGAADVQISFHRGNRNDEANRLVWIDELMTRNAICPNGYEIVDRRMYEVSYGGQVHYTAACS